MTSAVFPPMFVRALAPGLAVAVLLSLAFAGCGSSPTAPEGTQSGGAAATGTGGSGACRNGIGTYRITAQGPAFTSTTLGTCTFNRASVEGTCTNQYSDSLGNTMTSVSTTRNTSIAQVIDEVSVNPPLFLGVSTTTVVSYPNQPSTTGTATRTFNGRRVLTERGVSSPSGDTLVTTYTAWDSSDRPTAGTRVSSGGTSVAVNYTYDDAARSMSTRTGGTVCTQTFDQNGNPALADCGGVTQTTTVLSTIQICR